MEGIGSRSTAMGNLYNIHPEEWKNIALPIVEVITTLLREVYKLHLRQETDFKVVDKIEKNERDHYIRVTKDISDLSKKAEKETTRVQETVTQKFQQDLSF